MPGTIEEMQAHHWDLLYRVNIKGPFLGCKFVIPYTKEQNYGHIINISSVGATGPGEGPYAIFAETLQDIMAIPPKVYGHITRMGEQQKRLCPKRLHGLRKLKGEQHVLCKLRNRER